MEKKYKKNTDPIVGKLQPQAKELENVVLGALMLEKEAYYIVSDILKADYFYDRNNQKIYTAIADLAMQGQPIDMLTVMEQMRKNGTLEDIGGSYRLAELTGNVASSSHIETHALIIAQKYMARRMITFASRLEEKAFDPTVDIYELMEETEGELYEMSKQNIKQDMEQIDPTIKEAVSIMETAASRADGMNGLPSGFRELDKITCGWQNSDLIIVAARPAMGKTAFVLSMACNIAVDHKIPVGIFSLEMSKVQLVNRLISNVCQIEGNKIKTGQLIEAEWYQFDQRVKNLYGSPIYIDDTPSLSIMELRTKARRFVKEKDIKILFIDYLQLMNAGGIKTNNREQEISTISRSLKALAKELNIPIIALSQLNRNVESRTGDKRPQLSDLRESGAIEQDADMVCFIHRPEYYKITEDERGNSLVGLAEIIIAKHRNGATGDVRLRFKGDYAKFMNIDEDVAVREFSSNMNSDDSLPPIPPAGADFLNQGSSNEVPF